MICSSSIEAIFNNCAIYGSTSHLMICDTPFKQTTQTPSITRLVLLFLHAHSSVARGGGGGL